MLIQVQRQKSLLKILFFLSFFCVIDSFYISLKSPSLDQVTRKCFTNHVYKQERLLIDLQVPMLEKDLDVGIQVMLITKKQDGKKEHKNLFTEIIKEAHYKKTVLKQTHDIQKMTDDSSLEYETCIFLKNRTTISIKPKVDFEGSFLPPINPNDVLKNTENSSQVYLFSLNLLTRFSHVLQQKRSFINPVPSPHKYTKQNLEKLQKYSTRLLELAKQQISIHRENEKIEAKTQEHVKDLQNSIYSMSLTQSAVLVFGSLMHINLVRKYLTENKLI